MYEFFEVDRLAVHARDDQDVGQAGLSRRVKDSARVDFDTCVRVYANCGAVNSGHGADGLPYEVRIAGRIEQGEMQPVMFAVGYFGFDGVMMSFFFGIEIADAGPVIDAVLSGHSSRGDQ